jgi:hypothetical protein
VHRDEYPYGNTFFEYLWWTRRHLYEVERLALQPRCRPAESPENDGGAGGTDRIGDAVAAAEAQDQEQAGLGYHAGETMHLFSCAPGESSSDGEVEPESSGGDAAAFCESPSLLPPVAAPTRHTAIAHRLFPELQSGASAYNLDRDEGFSTTDRASGRQMKRAGDDDGGGRGGRGGGGGGGGGGAHLRNKQHKS